jgi:photosystem II stability/assembly factor-like uncharacterized protein
MKRFLFVQFFFLIFFTSLYSQKKFWVNAGKLPIIEQGVTSNTVLQGFNWVEVKDSFFVTLTNIAINSKSIIIGRLNNDLSRGLYKSTDGGRKWEKVIPKVPLLSDPQLKKGLFATEQEYQKLLERSRYIIQDIFAFGDDFYMINGDGQFAGTFLLRSKDLGKTWEKMSTLNVYSVITANANSLKKTESFADMSNNTFMGTNALFVSTSQDSGRTWNPTFEGRSNVGYIRTGQNNSVDSKYSTPFYKYKNEGIWYSETMFSNITKKTEEIHVADIRLIFRGRENGPLFSIVYPELRFLPTSFGTPVGEIHFCQSNDGGNTWQVISNINPGSYRGIHFVDCSNIIYASLTSPVEGFCRSNNGGKTWEQLTGLPVSPISGSISVASDGYCYYIDKNYLYKSTEKICITNQASNNESTTGVTVITHGFQLGLAPINPGEWAFDMADAILNRTGNGTIKKYNKESGEFETIKTIGVGGETILLFDWAEESNFEGNGYTEAAGDAMFAALMKSKISLENLHFIGHSRGTVVNTTVVERLLSLKIKNKNLPITVDQVTNIDAHDWGSAGVGVDLNDNYPFIPPIMAPDKYVPNNGVIAWLGVNFCDSYFQNNGTETPISLHGRLVSGTESNLWNKDENGASLNHTNIHRAYTATITGNNITKKGGYSYRYDKKQRLLSKQFGIMPDFDFYKTYKYSIDGKEKTRYRGILNGGLERGGTEEYFEKLPDIPGGKPKGYYLARLPGWVHHGGFIKGESVTLSEHGLTLSIVNKESKSNPVLRHNRLYIPVDANSISIKYRRLNEESGVIKFKIISQTQSNKFQSNEFNINKSQPNATEISVDITNFTGDVVVFEFELTSNGLGLPAIELDDIRLSKLIANYNSPAQTNTTNLNNIQKTEDKINISTKLPNTIENKEFNAEKGWVTTSGTSSFKNGVVTLETKKNKIPMYFESNEFIISEKTSNLVLVLDKSKVINGELTVYFTIGGIDDIIYSTKINNSLNKTLEVVDAVAKTAETGNIPDNKQDILKFESIKIDIKKFKGKNVKFKIGFETRGLLKSELLIDEIKLE